MTMKDAMMYAAVCAMVCGAFVAGKLSPGVRDAKADDAGKRVVSADSDPARSVGGTASTTAFAGQDTAEIATGPFYLTDVHAVDGQSRLFLVGSSNACSDPPTALLWHVSEINLFSPVAGIQPVHGARYLIKTTQKLCVKNETGSGNPSIVAWAGFRPYM
jgi:hypothetical protein